MFCETIGQGCLSGTVSPSDSTVMETPDSTGNTIPVSGSQTLAMRWTLSASRISTGSASVPVTVQKRCG